MGQNQRVIFANNLSRYMKSRGVDQIDIVAALGVSASTVSDWCAGKKYPRVDRMQKLADYLGVMLSDLTAEADAAPAEDPWQLRADLAADPDRALLLSLARNGSAKDVRQVAALIDALKATNPDFYDGDDPA